MLRRPGRPRAVGAGLLIVVLAAAGCGSAPPSHRSGSVTAARSSTASGPAASTSAPTTTTPAAAGSSTPPATSTASAAARVADRRADAAIARRTGYLGAGGVSIEATDLDSGRTYAYGAHGGMLCGSIAKLYILETLLLQHQRSGAPLDDATDDLATAMIENSDNEATNDLYVDIGEGPALRRAAAALGVEHTTPGPGIYWGFSRTSAADFVALLHNLVRPGALDAASRRYALGLMSHVESDQQWGVGTVADDGTTFYLKNGWLGADPDGGRWLVNTVGIVTVHGRRLLMAVLTQHGRDFDSGVDLVGRLAHITARAVTTG